MEIWGNVLDGIAGTTTIEWIAVASGILYLIFVTLKKMICWFFAFTSASLYIYICVTNQLYMESFLQFFYVVTAIYGWYSWRINRTQSTLIIQKWPIKNHIVNIIISSLVTLLLGYLFSTYTDQSYPYLDATTTVFSLSTTFLVIFRVLSNWVYWIVIDLLGMYLFHLKGLHLTSLLLLSYSIIAFFGYLKWHNDFKKQPI